MVAFALQFNDMRVQCLIMTLVVLSDSYYEVSYFLRTKSLRRGIDVMNWLFRCSEYYFRTYSRNGV